MSGFSRRTFLKRLGQGTAALGIGMGFAGKPWAVAPGDAPGQAQPQKVWDDLMDADAWEVYYPGVYDAADGKLLAELQAKLALINNRGEINVRDLISGKLDNAPGIVKRGGGHGAGGEATVGTEITHENMLRAAAGYGEDNPLFTDRQYGKKSPYGERIAFPFIAAAGGWPEIPSGELGDYKVISDLNVSQTFHRPVCEGDVLYTVLDRQDCVDITPAAGSRYRTFAISGTGRIFNQRGELVTEGAKIVKESLRRHKDPARRFTDGAVGWESPEWWYLRPRHTYTDEDWQQIIAMWKNEKIRGADVLYWDDVRVGDEPTARAVGPIISDLETDILMTSTLSTDVKRNVLDPKTFSTMVKNPYGMYVLPEHMEKTPASGPSTTAMSGAPELAHRDGRAIVENSVAAYWAAGMLLSWMGDAGWLQRFGWDIMAAPPGYPEYVIPPYPERPALFDKFPYFEKVPFLKGKRADCHGMEGDLIVSRAYVYDKYEKNGEYFVELVWWCETLDKYLIEEGFATVRLPKK